ncbi:AAA domain-containing protein [Steroidobacter sp.]|uniref:AAA domain-containing protein n=1 Tax=Steroidobacter sp. TaxID=1978227 RepID=UPI001A569F6D|nr:AAA domain-containing protein [Steroidobacter sp.]MBL8272026.1 AAA family ATPase [Steroidobacter sp.]
MIEHIRHKLRQLYLFLKEANQLRFPPVRHLSQHPRAIRLADAPDHPCVQINRPSANDGAQLADDCLLRIARPASTPCPTPPFNVSNWLLSDWDDPTKAAYFAATRNVAAADSPPLNIRFDDDQQRLADFEAWVAVREEWVIAELAARKALGFFELFYEIHSAIERDGELLELVAADGRLNWRAVSSIEGSVPIDHPVMLKRVELRFDASAAEFSIHETDRPTELYSALFVDLQNTAAASLRNRTAELENAGLHPWGADETETYLKTLVQTLSPTSGRLFKERVADEPSDAPRMWRDPMLILRKRVGGIANAVDAIIDDIDQRKAFAPAMAQIAGTSFEQTPSVPAAAIDDDEVLLGKEANQEQIQIIKRLSHSGSVLVQGPPGTGKTHTIANLIGHQLAQGKSILVTAQTAKALRVLRDKVPDVLRPLCVAVLGSDQDARRQLETSIGSITERLTTQTSASLVSRATRLGQRRRELLTELQVLQRDLREALENEYREIAVDERRFSPSDAAKYVKAHGAQHAWIPGPVKLAVPLPLNSNELGRLYALGAAFTADEEQDARRPLPNLDELPSEREFESLASEHRRLAAADLSAGSHRWTQTGSSAAIHALAATLAEEFSELRRRQAWRPYAIVAGINGGTQREVWEQLIHGIEEAAEANAQCALLRHHRPQLAKSMPADTQRRIAQEIVQHLEAGRGLGFLQMATRSEWRQFVKAASVAAGEPSRIDHFHVLAMLADLEVRRLELEDAWNALIGKHIDSLFRSMGSEPELACRALTDEVRHCLDWHEHTWGMLAERLRGEGLRLDELVSQIPREPSPLAEYQTVERLSSEVLPPLLATESDRRKQREIHEWFQQLAGRVGEIDPKSVGLGCASRLLAAVEARDASAYKAAREYVQRLMAVKPLTVERDELLTRLREVASRWADRLQDRKAPHDKGHPPGDLELAWIYRQLHDTLVQMDRLDAQTLQYEADRTRDRLRPVTQELIDATAWGQQLARLQGNNAIRQALIGWLDTAKRLMSTRHPERRQTLLTEARKFMKHSVEAVPVWIMPISMVAETFDPRATCFDLVIVDEASQADLNALIPLYMARQVVIVGDHEQVTPLGVGKEQTALENLRKSMLHDFPNAHLFDAMSSIYDIGRQAFGDAVRLIEHFRSVPEIIAFSNRLSYDGKILPLRAANSTHIKPACVPFPVAGARQGDVNPREAEAIVSLIKAMTRHPAYEGKTIGVISMVKEEQALLIQSLLHKRIDSVELEKRRILAGISAEFQGDERDIILLSLVDSAPEEAALRTVREGAYELVKKRYNVAASRARDQLWVVYSFDADRDLKTDDLRFQLLQHAQQPNLAPPGAERNRLEPESPLEREVAKRLSAAGFRVQQQMSVGHFRIDMVIESDDKRLAVECDGDRYRTPESLGEDIARQAVLERLGWEFVRIRGSAFYRDPDAALRRVFDRLEEIGIHPRELSSTPVEEAPPAQSLVEELKEMMGRPVVAATDAVPEKPTKSRRRFGKRP